jgi:hypothetical protein
VDRNREHTLHAAAAIAAVLVAAAVGYTGWKALPTYSANIRFEGDLRSEAVVFGIRESSAEALGDAIFRDAQKDGIPIRREDIRMDFQATPPCVTADYSVPADLNLFHSPIHFHVQAPRKKEIFTFFDRLALGAVGFLAGLYWFFQGFFLFREYRLVADTPTIPIRSMAMGRVQVSGKAAGEKTLFSPLSNQRCFLYKVDIDRWRTSRSGSGRWSPFLTDAASVLFYLEDETGKVLVDPEGAELDLQEADQREISARSAVPLGQAWQSEPQPAALPGLPKSDEELRDYVRRVKLGMDTAAFQGADLESNGKTTRRRSTPRRARGTLNGGLLGALMAVEPIPLGGSFDHVAGDLRLTEYCIFPEAPYDVTGTCSLRPKANDAPGGPLIAKASSFFLISNQSGGDLKESLRAGARSRILGGGVLALAFAAILLEALGLLV